MKNTFTNKVVPLAFILFVICIRGGQAQIQSNVSTPRGNSVTAWILPEASNADRAAADANTLSLMNYLNQGAGQRTLLYQSGQTYSSTRAYNCHGYAWNIVEGGPNRWIGYGATAYIAENVYMTDGSYIRVCSETFPAKVSWPESQDHSAVTTATPGRWRSKWGGMGWVEHGKEDQPYGASSGVTYWVSTAMTSNGSGFLCSGTRTFTIQNIPGATYTWNVSSTLSILSGAGTNQLTVQRNGTAVGNASVSVQISTPCSGSAITTTSNFVVGVPTATVNTSDDRTPQPSNYTYHTATAQLINGKTASNYRWYEEASGSATNLTFINSGLILNRWPIPPCSTKFYQLQITTACGTSVYRGYAYNTYGCGGGFAFSAYPNPTDNQLTVEKTSLEARPSGAMTDQEAIDYISASQIGLSETFDVELYDKYSQLLKKGKASAGKLAMDLKQMPRGLYFLRITDGKNVITKQIMIVR